jgi:hypothetical protein
MTIPSFIVIPSSFQALWRYGPAPSFGRGTDRLSVSTDAFHMSENRAFPLHLFEQDFPDQIEGCEHFGIAQPVVHDISILAGHNHAALFHHVQVLREVANGNPKQACHVRDGHFLVPEGVQDLQAQWM